MEMIGGKDQLMSQSLLPIWQSIFTIRCMPSHLHPAGSQVPDSDIASVTYRWSFVMLDDLA